LGVKLRSNGSATARPVYLQQRTYLVTASAAVGGSLVPLCGLTHRSKQHLHSIISSAATSSVCGIVRASALAVLRLITSSNVVGWITGKSEIFACLKTTPALRPAGR